MRHRLDYLDHLRTALTVLVLVFHTSIAYGGAGSWILEDVDKSELNATIILFTIFTAVCQAFFMGLFFFLTAYFIPASYDRKGAAKLSMSGASSERSSVRLGFWRLRSTSRCSMRFID